MNGVFIFLFFQDIVYMDMDSGDARKESIEGSDAMSLQGGGKSQHNHVEEVISHNKPKRMLIYMLSHKVFFYIIINIFCDIIFCIQLIWLIFVSC